MILFWKDNPAIVRIEEVASTLGARGSVMWALEMAEGAANRLSEMGFDTDIPNEAISTSREWARGRVKMPTSKRRILECHRLADSTDSAEAVALYHAIGQACGVVHTRGHILGLPIYELTSIVRRYGIADCTPHVERRMDVYIDRMGFWKDDAAMDCMEWAGFLSR